MLSLLFHSCNGNKMFYVTDIPASLRLQTFCRFFTKNTCITHGLHLKFSLLPVNIFQDMFTEARSIKKNFVYYGCWCIFVDRLAKNKGEFCRIT